MVTLLATIFGWVMLAVGIAGFIPALTPDGHLLGIFAVGVLHNLVHVVTGLAALAVAYSRPQQARTFFQVFAVVYGLVAVLGLFHGDAAVLGVLAHNWADFWLHVAITAFAAWAGFFTSTERFAVATR